MSIFQDSSIGVDNPQSREEDEELEEQRRRQEELADLLAAGIHAFNYDESTINSSVTSVEDIENKKELKSVDKNETVLDATSVNSDIEKIYKNADQNEQLKLLYDVRVREINNLRNEFEKFKEDKANEIKILKNKVTLSEAEICHLQISLTNSESLVVEKNDVINNLKQSLSSQDKQIEDLKKLVEDQNLELCTYKSVVTELQLKLADNNPFSASNKKFKSEELQKAHQDQIIKLETLLQEQNKKNEILEKEKLQFQEELQKLVKAKNETENEDNLTIMALSKKLQSAQQQCKDLFLLGEAIKKESDHFKERMQQFDNQLDLSGEHFKNLDKETLVMHLEKLKRMILDKDIELNTLKTKQKFYESDFSELFEYRRLLNDIYSYEFKPCNNLEHEELIIFMRGQLQTFQQAIEDRNNQIMNLNLVNKELQEKIEETIQQTRNDIQNISQKYSLPQLETMSNELKNAEATIRELNEKLLEKDSNKQEEISNLQNKVEELQKKIKEFQTIEKQLIEENGKVKTQLQKICLKLGVSETEIFESDVHELSNLQAKYGKIHEQLQHVFAHLENTNMRSANYNIIYNLKKQLENYLGVMNSDKYDKKKVEEEIEQWDNMLCDFIESLKNNEGNQSQDLNTSEKMQEFLNYKTILEGEKVTLEDQLKIRDTELEKAAQNTEALNTQLQELKDNLQSSQNVKKELEEKLNEAKSEIITLQKLNKQNSDLVKQQLAKELKQVENVLEQAGDDVLKDEVFQKCLQAQILKAEISLREQFQEETVKRLQKIEEHYKNVISEKTETFNKEREKWKRQEVVFRKQFATVLDECGKKMNTLEAENVTLIKRVNGMVQEYKTFKDNALASLGKYNKMIANCKKTVEEMSKKWEALLENYVSQVMQIDKQRRKTTKTLLKKIDSHQTELNLIEKLYDEKIMNFKSQRLNGSALRRDLDSVKT